MNNSLKRRLIFHFYVPVQWRELEIVKLHLKMLKHYSNVFNETLFVISIDNFDYIDDIREFEKRIIDCGFYNVNFKVVLNDRLYESRTLYEEIMSKLDKLDGLTFFGHSKGIGNEILQSATLENIKKWVFGLYYFSLNNIWEVESKLYGVKSITYGPFKTLTPDSNNEFHWYYSGTFFWLNTSKLYNRIKYKHLQPRLLSDRFYSELCLGDIIPASVDTAPFTEATSMYDAYIKGDKVNYYDDISLYIDILCDDNTKNNFYQLFNEIDNED